MSDQSNAVAFPGEGQAGDPSEQEANAAQRKYLTRNDLTQIADEITEQVVRRTQGLIDSQTSNINKRIQEGLSSLKSVVEIQRNAGIEITPEQEQVLRQRVISEAYTAEPSSPPETSESSRKPKPESPGEQELDPVTAEGLSMMEEAGVFITNDDPEAAKLLAARTPRQYFKAVEEAIAAKQARTSTENTQGGKGGASRTPTNAGGGGEKASLRRQYNEEVKGVRGDVWAVVQLKQKYRKMGLDI